MTDTFISGCGVFPDAALPEGTRLRLSPTGNPSEDVEVYVEDGHIHLVGHYTPILAIYDDAHHARVRPLAVRCAP